MYILLYWIHLIWRNRSHFTEVTPRSATLILKNVTTRITECDSTYHWMWHKHYFRISCKNLIHSISYEFTNYECRTWTRRIRKFLYALRTYWTQIRNHHVKDLLIMTSHSSNRQFWFIGSVATVRVWEASVVAPPFLLNSQTQWRWVQGLTHRSAWFGATAQRILESPVVPEISVTGDFSNWYFLSWRRLGGIHIVSWANMSCYNKYLDSSSVIHSTTLPLSFLFYKIVRAHENDHPIQAVISQCRQKYLKRTCIH